MTVAFEFEEKKEEEDNSGKVKVSQDFLLTSVSPIFILLLPLIFARPVCPGWDQSEALPHTVPRGPEEHGEVSAEHGGQEPASPQH